MTRDVPTLGIVPKLLFLALVAALVWVWRPTFHPIIYRVAYSPGGALAIGIPLLVGIALFLAPPSSTGSSDSVELKGFSVGVVFVVCLVLAVIVGGYGGMVEERTLASQTMHAGEEIEEFPQMNAENARIAPRKVADVQTRASVSYRQHRLGTSDIARAPDGTLTWSYSIEPDGLRNTMYERQRGVLLSDMTQMENREISAYDDTEFEVGQGMWVRPPADHRGVEWNLKKQHFWTQYRDDPVEFVHDGQPYMYFPKTGHDWVWLSESLVPHTVPTWEGGALVHPDGTIEHLRPEEAQSHEALAGQRLYPLYNAEREVASLGYREGIWNQMVRHENEIEPANLPAGAGNSQPFVIDLAGERMAYVMAMEPYGDDTRGLDEVWIVDSRTGQPEYYATGSETLTGPERAMGVVRGSDTQTDWDHGEDSGQFRVVEPIPVTVDGDLWWHSKVVPKDNTDVARNVFVSTEDGEVVEATDTESVYEFLRTGDEDVVEAVGGSESGGENGTSSTGSGLYVVITDENGTVVERVPVEEDEEVQIRREAS